MNVKNNKLYFNGSISVIPKAYDVRLPAALPLPGPTKISFVFEYFIKS